MLLMHTDHATDHDLKQIVVSISSNEISEQDRCSVVGTIWATRLGGKTERGQRLGVQVNRKLVPAAGVAKSIQLLPLNCILETKQ
jgi:hypothetical protein